MWILIGNDVTKGCLMNIEFNRPTQGMLMNKMLGQSFTIQGISFWKHNPGW